MCHGLTQRYRQACHVERALAQSENIFIFIFSFRDLLVKFSFERFLRASANYPEISQSIAIKKAMPTNAGAPRCWCPAAPARSRSHTVHLCDARPASGAGCALSLCVRVRRPSLPGACKKNFTKRSLAQHWTILDKVGMVLALVQDWASSAAVPLMGGPRVGATSNPRPGIRAEGAPDSSIRWAPRYIH